jgi:DNA ligase-4
MVLDGEMITWDPIQDAPVPFGQLKSAALEEKVNPLNVHGYRPLYVIFDIVFLNGKSLTNYSWNDRRKVLSRVVKDIPRRFEKHKYSTGRISADIEKALRAVIASGSEGLVIKDMNSIYGVSERNDSWIKVKPEYMNEFGEELDCLIIGGYYGEGSRGGRLASFLCGLRVDSDPTQPKFHSFCRVGGGLAASDFARIRQLTEHKWKKWDYKRPPREFYELAGDERQSERPDEWIAPSDSVVIQVKAASVSSSDTFRTGVTLRFPRFQRMREDKDWTTALSYQSFEELRRTAEKDQHKKVMEPTKRRRLIARQAKVQEIVGQVDYFALHSRQKSGQLFDGKRFSVLTGSQKIKKQALEALIVENNGILTQNVDQPDVIVVADREVVQVSVVKKKANKDIVKPQWILDCIENGRIMPFEPKRMLYVTSYSKEAIFAQIDEYGDSYISNTTPSELSNVLKDIDSTNDMNVSLDDIVRELRQVLPDDLPGWMFADCNIFIDSTSPYPISTVKTLIEFGRGKVSPNMSSSLSHVIVKSNDKGRAKEIRQKISRWKRIPHIVGPNWIIDSLENSTQLAVAAYAV